MTDEEVMNLMLENRAKQLAKRNYESNLKYIMSACMGEEFCFYDPNVFYVSMEKEHINLFCHDIPIRCWHKDVPSKIECYFEKIEEVFLCREDWKRIMEYMDDLN